MHKNGEAGLCHSCFQSIMMAGLPGVEVLALGNVGDVYHFICPNSTPSFFGKQLLSHLVLFKPWDGHVTWLGLILVTQSLTSVIGPGICKWPSQANQRCLGMFLTRVRKNCSLFSLLFRGQAGEYSGFKSPSSSVRMTPIPGPPLSWFCEFGQALHQGSVFSSVKWG